MRDFQSFAEGFIARAQHGAPMATGRFWLRWLASLAAVVAVVALVWRQL